MRLSSRFLLYVLSVIFVTIIPLELVILHFQEERFSETRNQELTTNAKMLAQSMVTIILMNGGELRPSMIDAQDMIQVIEPLKGQGLVYADIVLKIQNENRDKILASITRKDFTDKSRAETTELAKKIPVKEITGNLRINNQSQSLMAVAMPGTLKDGTVVCVTRLFFDQREILKPIDTIKEVMISTSIGFFSVMIIIMLFISRSFTRPILHLARTARQIAYGDLSARVKPGNSDEINTLATSFNQMTEALRIKITELEETNIELNRINGMKDDFLASTTHELRTPLNGIIGIIESTGTGNGDENLSGKNLELVLSSARRLLKLVNDILDMARLKHREVTLNKTPIDVETVISTAVDIVKPLVGNRDVRIELQTIGSIPPIIADEERIQQVFINLIENAVKFTQKGKILISARINENGYVEVTVSDTGIGIPSASMDRIFDDFVQGDSTVARRFGGTGLGLSITRQLIELHSGTIHAASKEGEGTSFTVLLPADHAEPVERPGIIHGESRAVPVQPKPALTDTAAPPFAAQGPGSGKSALIVDDEPVNIQVLLNLLTLEGFRTITAHDGFETLKLIDDGFLPDIILLDVMMPGLSGFEVCREIRKKHSSHTLPVLMLTALKRNEDIEAGFASGANDFVSKPFERRELLARISTLVYLKEAAARNLELEIFENEMAIARQIQQAILPRELPAVDGIALSVAFRPMRSVAGDLYDFHTFQKKKLGIFMADVTGHGAPAAIISAMVKVVFAGSTAEADYPEYLLQRCNTMLTRYTTNHFLTALYALIDLDNMKVTVARGGHWPLTIYRRETNEIIRIKPNGMILGLSVKARYEIAEVDLIQGDRIILYTDGILEQQNAEQELFTETRLLDLLRDTRDLPAREFTGTVLTVLEEWSGKKPGEPFDDDVSLLVVDVLPQHSVGDLDKNRLVT